MQPIIADTSAFAKAVALKDRSTVGRDEYRKLVAAKTVVTNKIDEK